MHSETYLIAHIVRGEPAFDIAVQMECPICAGKGHFEDWKGLGPREDGECDGLGYWWIIPSFGHRAKPYWYVRLRSLASEESWAGFPEPPDDWPDLFQSSIDNAPVHDLASGRSLIEALGLVKPKEPFRRRV